MKLAPEWVRTSEIATQWSEAQHATAVLRRPPGLVNEDHIQYTRITNTGYAPITWCSPPPPDMDQNDFLDQCTKFGDVRMSFNVILYVCDV